MVNLGGLPITGRGRVTGEPLREVRIDLPQSVPMTAPEGGAADLSGFTTDLPSHPTLDANGELNFSFGARLVLRSGRIVPKADLERLVLGFEAELASNALEVHVSALRRKLGRHAESARAAQDWIALAARAHMDASISRAASFITADSMEGF